MREKIFLLLFSVTLFASIQSQNIRLNKASEILTKRYAKESLKNLEKPTLASDIIKSEFETNAQYIARYKQAEIKNIQYKQQINKIMAQSQISALGAVLPSLYGEISLSKLKYFAEKKAFIGMLSCPKMDIHETISIAMPSSQARQFKTSLKKIKFLPVFEIKENTIYLEKIKFIFNEKKYYGKFTNTYFNLSQPVLTLNKNYLEIEQESTRQQEEYMLSNKLFENDLENALEKSTSVPKDKTKWAFIIGIEDYVFTEKISYAKRSAERYAQVIQKKLGVPKNQTTLLINQRATGSIIKNSLKTMLRRVKKGDTIYFYYNGHGIPVPSEKNEPYMLASDMSVEYVQDDKFFALKNIYKTLTDSKADTIIAVVDSCFSGATDGKVLLKGVAAARLIPKKIGFDKEKLTVITAGQKRQYSNGYDKKGYRLFSYYIMKDILAGEKRMDTLFNTVYTQTKNTSYQLYGDLRIQEPSFAGNIKKDLN